MGFTLEERTGVKVKHINTLIGIGEATGVYITEHKSMDGFCAAWFQTMDTDTLQELLDGAAGPMSDFMLHLMQSELTARISTEPKPLI